MPFRIIYSYTLNFTIPARKHSNILALDGHFKCMTQIWKKAEASLCQAKLYIKKDYEAVKKLAHLF